MPTTPPTLKVKLSGQAVDAKDLFEICVDLDLDQPDMCSVVVSNVQAAQSAKVKAGDALEITADSATIFKGEVVGIEPVYDHGMPSRCTVRALNRMHRLAQGRKSKTFEKLSDQDIVTQICQSAGLQATCDSDTKITHDHVYQHNQTDLEFIRQRAARIDYEVLVDDTKLYFRKRVTNDSGETLDFGNDGALQRFRPRLSSANQVSKVICRGWDPIKKQEIVGTASAEAVLGDQHGPAAAQLTSIQTVETDKPVYTQEEADAVAKAILKARQMDYITGDALVLGSPKLKAGIVVTVDVQDPRFNGKYYIVSCRHRYVHSVAGVGGIAHKEAGYRTFLKVKRDAESSASASSASPAAASAAASSPAAAAAASPAAAAANPAAATTAAAGADAKAADAASATAADAGAKAADASAAATGAAAKAADSGPLADVAKSLGLDSNPLADATNHLGTAGTDLKGALDSSKSLGDRLDALGDAAKEAYAAEQSAGRQLVAIGQKIQNLEATAVTAAEGKIDSLIDQAGAKVLGAVKGEATKLFGDKVGAMVSDQADKLINKGEAAAKDEVKKGGDDAENSSVGKEINKVDGEVGGDVSKAGQDMVDAPKKAEDAVKEEIDKAKTALEPIAEKIAGDSGKQAVDAGAKAADDEVDKGAEALASDDKKTDDKKTDSKSTAAAADDKKTDSKSTAAAADDKTDSKTAAASDKKAASKKSSSKSSKKADSKKAADSSTAASDDKKSDDSSTSSSSDDSKSSSTDDSKSSSTQSSGDSSSGGSSSGGSSSGGSSSGGSSSGGSSSGGSSSGNSSSGSDDSSGGDDDSGTELA